MASPTAPATTSSPECETLSLRVDVVLQNSAFLVVRAQPQLFLLIGAHHSIHSHPSVCGGIYVPFQRFVVLVLVQFVSSFLHRF